MKRIVIFLFFVISFSGVATAQDNMTQWAVDLPQSMQLNPAMRPTRSFLSIPIFGSFQLGVNNSFSYNDIITKRDGIKYINNDALIAATSAPNSGMSLNLNLDLINAGFYISHYDFIGISVRGRLHTAMNYPSGLFGFIVDNPISNTNSLFDINYNGNVLGWAEFGLSYSRSIGDNVTVGIRAKYVGGIATIQTGKGVQFNVEKQLDRYTLSGDYEIQAGNINLASQGGVNAADMVSGMMKNPGFGIDLGVNITSNDKKLNVTASVSDLGWIFWNAKNSSKLKVRNPNTKFDFDGLGDLMSGEIDMGKAMDSVLNTFSRIVGVDTLSGVGFSTQLPLTFQAGFNYSIDDYFRHNVSFGAIGSLPYRGGFNYAVSAGYTYRTLNGMWQLMANYTYSNYSPYGLGLGVVFTAGVFQMYLASDDILPFFNVADARRANARIAFNFFFNRR